MRAGLILAAAVALTAQQSATVQTTVRGKLLEWDASDAGQMLVRAADNRVHCIRFDAKTEVDSRGWHTRMASLHKGDMVEVAVVPGPTARQSYARSVLLLGSPAPAPQPRRERARPEPAARSIYDSLDDLFPRGNLTFSGTVVEINSGRVILRTREKETTSILLRPDTKYIQDGSPSSSGALRVNTRVFVRAGKNLDNEIEAYRVVWGRILQPGK
jgi:hypothetical protein